MLRAMVEERGSMMMQVRKGGRGAEIGVHEGQFSQRIMRIARPEKLYLVDPWEYRAELDQSLYGGAEMSQQKMDRRYAGVCKRLSGPIAAGRASVLRMASQAALAEIADASLDFAYIDGDHSYAAVKADLEGWLGKLVPGGLLIADDYLSGGWWGDDVIRACHGFLAQYPVEIECKLGSQIAFRKL